LGSRAPGEAPRITGDSICRILKPRLDEARQLSPHSFVVTTTTDLLEDGYPAEDIQHFAGYHDQRERKIRLNFMERISIEIWLYFGYN
jgi:hypothetical protein